MIGFQGEAIAWNVLERGLELLDCFHRLSLAKQPFAPLMVKVTEEALGILDDALKHGDRALLFVVGPVGFSLHKPAFETASPTAGNR